MGKKGSGTTRLQSHESTAQLLEERFGDGWKDYIAAAETGLHLASLFAMLNDPHLVEILEHFAEPPEGTKRNGGRKQIVRWRDSAGPAGEQSFLRASPAIAELVPLVAAAARMSEQLAALGRLSQLVTAFRAPLHAPQRLVLIRKLSLSSNMACACVWLLTEQRLGRKPSPLELTAILAFIGDPAFADFVPSRDEQLTLETRHREVIRDAEAETLPLLKKVLSGLGGNRGE